MRCIIVDDDKFVRQSLQNFVEQTDSLELVRECKDAIEAINFLRKETVDLIFLDIEMPGLSGMDLIKNLEEKPLIILITSHTEFAVEAFEFDVLDYIIKPIEYGRFVKAVSKAEDRLLPKKVSSSEKFLFVRSDLRTAKVTLKDILWIEGLGNYVKINTAKKVFTVHSTMKDIVSKLPSNDFIRVHKSYIARIDNIQYIQNDVVQLDKKWLPIGNSYKSDLIKRLNML